MRHNFIGFVGMQVFEVLWFVCVCVCVSEEKRQYSHCIYILELLDEFKTFEGFFPMRNPGNSMKHIKPKVVFFLYPKFNQLLRLNCIS
jgi:hypothetical protein